MPATIALTIQGDSPTNATGANDTITIGNQSAQFNGTFDGNLDAVAGSITVVGGAGGGDVLNVDDSGDATADVAANAGVLTDSSLAGLNMANGITSYTTVESVNLILGTGGDELNVRSSATGVVYQLDTDAPTAAGDDTINVGSNASVLTTSTLDSIDGQLNINTRGGTDALNVSDAGDADADTYVFSFLAPRHRSGVWRRRLCGRRYSFQRGGS